MVTEQNIAVSDKNAKISRVEHIAIPVVIIVFLLLLFAFAIILNHLIYRYMLQTSKTLLGLMELNKNAQKGLPGPQKQVYSVHIRCKRKEQYDAHQIEYNFAMFLADHFKTYESIYKMYQESDRAYATYLSDYKNLATTLGGSWRESMLFGKKRYTRLEKKIYELQMLKKPTFRFNVWKTYTSPKRRNHYSDRTTIYPATFNKICEGLYEQEAKRKKINEERAKLTDHLRYLIFVRDRFTCQICGRKQEDGVTLHIDHIIPVSKGGKTVPENLRVLCDQCNLGKSDRYDPNGLN